MKLEKVVESKAFSDFKIKKAELIAKKEKLWQQYQELWDRLIKEFIDAGHFEAKADLITKDKVDRYKFNEDFLQLNVGDKEFVINITNDNRSKFEALIDLFQEMDQCNKEIKSIKEQLEELNDKIEEYIKWHKEVASKMIRSPRDSMENLTMMDGVYEEQQEIEYEKFICKIVREALLELTYLPDYKGDPFAVDTTLEFSFIPKGMRVESEIVQKNNNGETVSVPMLKDAIQLRVNNRNIKFGADINLYNHFLEAIKEYCIKTRKKITLGKNKSYILKINLGNLLLFYKNEMKRLSDEHWLDSGRIVHEGIERNEQMYHREMLKNLPLEDVMGDAERRKKDYTLSDSAVVELLTDIAKGVLDEFSRSMKRYFDEQELNDLPINIELKYNTIHGFTVRYYATNNGGAKIVDLDIPVADKISDFDDVRDITKILERFVDVDKSKYTDSMLYSNGGMLLQDRVITSFVIRYKDLVSIIESYQSVEDKERSK